VKVLRSFVQQVLDAWLNGAQDAHDQLEEEGMEEVVLPGRTILVNIVEDAGHLGREIADMAEPFGIEIEISHHEVALGQNEIDFKYGEALVTADRAITMKMVTKVVAARNGYLSTHMPKPFAGINGSGMHTHQSLWNKENTQNLFYADNANNGYLSDIARNFIGGQLAHGRQMAAVLASWPNSYKRLVPGYEAPVYLAWAHKNRSPLIRYPTSVEEKPGLKTRSMHSRMSISWSLEKEWPTDMPSALLPGERK
jgi:glutamine synthetase